MVVMNKFDVVLQIDEHLQNKLSRDVIQEFNKVQRDKKEAWEEENWKRKAYWSDESMSGVKIPDVNLLGMMVNACRKYRVPPPKSIGRTWTNYAQGSFICDFKDFQFERVEAYGSMVNGNPSAKGKSSKVWKVRPKFINSQLRFEVIDLQGSMSAEILKDILSGAGFSVGFGDYRPVFGRFAVKRCVKC